MKSLYLSLLGIVVVYGLLLLVMYFNQKQMLYFPPPANPAMASSTSVMEFANGQQRGWILHPKKNKALIYYGGNAEAIENNIPQFENLFSGHTVYLIPYRGYSGNPGKPTEAQIYQDALAQFDQINAEHDGITLYGRSLGTGVATFVASQRQVENLLLVTPFDSLKNVASFHYWYAPTGLLMQENYDSSGRAKHIKASVLIIGAAMDQVVPPKFARKLASAFDPSQVTLTILENADHQSVNFHPWFRKTVLQFLQ